MEKMPYQPEADICRPAVMPVSALQLPTSSLTSDWRQSLPVLKGEHVVLRELRASDAASLHAMLTTEEVSRFISPPPTTVDGFERFIAWALRQRAVGTYACFAVTLRGYDTAIGLFQVREIERGFGTAEWGFAIGSAFWGTGVFQDGAELVLEFAFETLRRAPPRGARRRAQRARYWRAAEDRCRPGMRPARVARAQRRVPRSGAVLGARRRLARVAPLDGDHHVMN